MHTYITKRCTATNPSNHLDQHHVSHVSHVRRTCRSLRSFWPHRDDSTEDGHTALRFGFRLGVDQVRSDQQVPSPCDPIPPGRKARGSSNPWGAWGGARRSENLLRRYLVSCGLVGRWAQKRVYIELLYQLLRRAYRSHMGLLLMCEKAHPQTSIVK